MSRDCRNCIYGCFSNHQYPRVKCRRRESDGQFSIIYSDDGEFAEFKYEAHYCEDFTSRGTFGSEGLKAKEGEHL